MKGCQIIFNCFVCLLLTQLSACAYWSEFSRQPDWTLEESVQKTEEPTHPPVYVRRMDQHESPLLDQTVSANFPPGTTALQKAIVSALPFPVTVLVRDDKVDLQKHVGVRVKDVSVQDYLQYLENSSAYNIQFNPENMTVEVASIVTKTWYLPAMAGMGSFYARLGLGSAQTGLNTSDESDQNNNDFERSHKLQTNIVYAGDVWKSIVNHAHCILRLAQCERENSSGQNSDIRSIRETAQEERSTAWLVENRRLGTITATGSPREIQQLDLWLSKLSKDSLRMVRLDCAILDIALDESDRSGLDIDAMFGSNGDVVQVTRQGGAVGGNVWTVGANFSSGRFDMDLFLRNLSTRSSVKIKSRAKLSVTNGATAYLNTGEIFSYISDVNTVATEGVATTSFNQNRLQVGLEVAITPRFVSNKNKIMLEVVPVLSSLVRYDRLGTGNTAITAPVIALRQLSTQAITQNGQPITIGGLSWDKFSDNKNGFAEGFQISDWLSSRSKEFESRQLLIIITPEEITI